MTEITANEDRHRIFVAMRLGLGPDAFSNTCGSVAIEEDGQILAAVVYSNFSNFTDTGRAMCWASIAAIEGTNWCTRRFLKAILAYPFEGLGICVLRTMCAKTNKKARRFNEKLGLRFSGIARRSWDGRQDAAHYDMLPHEASKWLGYEPTGWKNRAAVPLHLMNGTGHGQEQRH